MRLWCCLRADLRAGISEVRGKLLLVSIVTAGVIAFTVLVGKAVGYEGIRWNLAGTLGSCFGGINEFRPDMGDRFRFPAAWMVTLTSIAYVPLSYPYRDLMGFGRSVLISSGSRGSWWLSKCLWTVVVTLLSCCLVLVICVAGALLSGDGLGLDMTGQTPLAIGFMPTALEGSYDLSRYFLSVPFLLCALCLMQMSLSLALKPVLSLAFTAALLLGSAFVMHPLLPGNYLMAARTAVVAEGGMSPVVGIVLAAVIGAASVLLGYQYFSRMDCMDKEFEA